MNLPDSKSNFPKCLYLDQNKWVDLAKTHHGRSENKAHKDALDAIRSAVASGRLHVPISHVHVMETMAPEDSGRRRRLAEFMVEISQNHSILPDQMVRPMEIRNSLLAAMGKFPDRSIRAQIIRDGLFAALGLEIEINGLPGEIKRVCQEKAKDPSISVDLLVRAADPAMSREARDRDQQATVAAEAARRRSASDLAPEMRDRVEFADLVLNGPPLKELTAALIELGVPREEFKSLLPGRDDYISFFHSIATLDVEINLIHARDRDLARPIHRNDAKDIIFLSVAVPYCNIVVLENFWAHVLKSTKLDRKYNTSVSTDIGDLRRILTSEGCLL